MIRKQIDTKKSQNKGAGESKKSRCFLLAQTVDYDGQRPAS